jgi:hypothetical protein
MEQVEVHENQHKRNVVYRYALDTMISYNDLGHIVTSLPEQHKYSFSLSNYEEMESFIYGFKNKDEILNFYENHPELYEAEILCITERFDGRSIIYRFDLNTNDCAISMPLGSPEYTETLDLIEKAVLESKKTDV